jgi:hypothetical protein
MGLFARFSVFVSGPLPLAGHLAAEALAKAAGIHRSDYLSAAGPALAGAKVQHRDHRGHREGLADSSGSRSKNPFSVFSVSSSSSVLNPFPRLAWGSSLGSSLLRSLRPSACVNPRNNSPLHGVVCSFFDRRPRPLPLAGHLAAKVLAKAARVIGVYRRSSAVKTTFSLGMGSIAPISTSPRPSRLRVRNSPSCAWWLRGEPRASQARLTPCPA